MPVRENRQEAFRRIARLNIVRCDKRRKNRRDD
jgi:hypothetical protein